MKQAPLFLFFLFSFIGYGQQTSEVQTPPPRADTRIYIDCETGFYNLAEHSTKQITKKIRYGMACFGS
ncbi:hypothetical protein CHX27_02180 [Flavobacterium aurantiibacter]|uniref:Uncharacterized protein n=1 Tax=Flavobacterium aurantiibacter TaxID=2023067 RepID=A0A256A4E1_9FLAO|nr:hypothetical protein CHX27_02180 [Flavobacterium aurantiibacter]